MPKAEAEELDAYCSSRNLSKAGFIRAAIKEKMVRDETSEDNTDNGSDAAEYTRTKSDEVTEE